MCICVFTNKTTFRTKQIHIRRCAKEKTFAETEKGHLCICVSVFSQQNHSLRESQEKGTILLYRHEYFYFYFIPLREETSILTTIAVFLFTRRFWRYAILRIKLCVRNFIFPHFVMVIILCRSPPPIQRTSWAFSAGTKIIPATKESYRVYIGTSSLKADIYPH